MPALLIRMSSRSWVLVKVSAAALTEARLERSRERKVHFVFGDSALILAIADWAFDSVRAAIMSSDGSCLASCRAVS